MGTRGPWGSIYLVLLSENLLGERNTFDKNRVGGFWWKCRGTDMSGGRS